MAETRTQQATARKLAQARARGDVAFTSDWVSAALLGVVCVWIAQAGPALASALRELMHESLSGLAPSPALWLTLARSLALLLLPLPVAAWFAILIQRGLSFGTRGSTGGAGQRLAQAFGPEAWQRSAAASIKLALLLGVFAVALRGSIPGILEAFTRDASDLSALLARIAQSLISRVALALVVIGALDWVYQRWRRDRRLRMSRRELLDEHRETEGDPQLRQRRKQSWSLLAHASLADLDAATLVIAGTGRAVALRYRHDVDAAPALWIKAEGQLAEALIARAYALAVPVFSDETLTLALQRLEPSEPIPEATHARVASLLTAADPTLGARTP